MTALFVPASEIREANYNLSLGRWHDLKVDWPTFLDDFQRHWPTDEETSMSISSATALRATARRAWAIPTGDG